MNIINKYKIIINALKNTENKSVALEKALKEYKYGGIAGLKNKILSVAAKNNGEKYVLNSTYESNMKIFNSQQEQFSLEEMNNRINEFKNKPKVSIVMPVYNVPIKWLEKAIDSILNQVYENWELCAVDDCSTNQDVIDTLKKYSKKDNRIKTHFSIKNGGISVASNICLEMATGEYIALMDNDDELTPDALFWVVNEINDYPEVDFIYSDECICDDSPESKKIEFQFKPDWSPESLMGFMYTGHLTVYKKELVKSLGGFRSEYDFGQDYDLALRVSEKSKCIRHIERVLYIWRAIDGSIAKGGKESNIKIGAMISSEAMDRKGLKSITLLKPYGTYHRIILSDQPKVSLIIPTNNIEMITTCIESIVNNTSYSNYEIIVVSDKTCIDKLKIKYSYLINLKYCEYDDKLNYSAKCNIGSSIASGEYLIFSQDDIVVNNSTWINQLLENLKLPNIGGVSPKIIQVDDTIRYSGMISGVFGLVSDPFQSVYKEHFDNHWTRHKWTRNVTVLSASCFAIKKSIFDDIGGFDEINIPNRLSNVDLSYKIIETGRRCVYTPNIEMRHIGDFSLDSWGSYFDISASSDAYLLKKWGKYIENDPYYTESMKKSTITHIPLDYKIYSNKINKDTTKNILLVSHELSMTGAPVVLHQAAKAILEAGYFPVIVSPTDGKLREYIEKDGIMVIIDPSIMAYHENFKRFALSFDLIISNTLVTRDVINQLGDSNIPIIWWLHEGKVSFDVLEKYIPSEIGENIKTYAVGDYVVDKMPNKYTYKENISILPYGIPDYAIDYIPSYNKDKIVFTIVGTIDHRKAQNIFIDAIYELPENYRKKARFIIVGKNYTDGLKEKIYKATENIKEIEYWGEVTRDKIIDINKLSDVMVSTSVDDPMPVVLTEAMMFSKVCICTDSTGTSKLINNNVDGFVVKTNDYKAIAKIMMQIIDSPDLLCEIGPKSRKIYEDNFLISKFNKSLMKEIDKNINNIN